MRRLVIGLVAILLAGTLWISHLQPAGATEYQGAAIPVLTVTPTGVEWSGHVQDFVPNAPIVYHWVLDKDGFVLIEGEHGGYYTDGGGFHFRLPPGFPQAVDCGPGWYTLHMWAATPDGAFHTWSYVTTLRKA